MNLRIALDVDDVLARFTPHAHDFHGVPMETCNYWCVKTMDERLGEKWFSEHIAPVKEFWRTIPVLSLPSDIDFPVACYISAFPEDMYEERLAWLKYHGFPDAPLIASFNKLSTCLEMGIDVLIDDKPETMKKLQGSPIRGLHFMAPYAGFEAVGESITNLNQVKKKLGMDRKKLMICGSMRHGKDTVAEMLQELFGYKFASSSETAAEIFLYDVMKERYGYTSPEQCFEDRVNHRAEWKELICEYNTPDKARLAREIMSRNDIYVGMRDTEEIAECKRQKIFDLIIGVYNPRLPEEPKDSMPIDMWKESDIVVSNAGTLDDLRKKIELLKPLLIT